MNNRPIKITILKENKQLMFEMSKLTARNADKSICGDFGTMIYFSEVQAGHGPRIKFDGGTKEILKCLNEFGGYRNRFEWAEDMLWH